MDYDEIHEAPGLAKETINRIPCDVMFCGKFADDYDPIWIEGRPFCDSCASDLVSLRFDGALNSVSSKTFMLRKAHDRVSDKTHKLKLENSHRLYK